MKVAILTLPLHTNYGGILQAYALQTVLQRMGHDAEVLQCSKPLKKRGALLMPLVYGKRLAVKLLKNNEVPIFFERKSKREWPIIRQHTNRFLNSYLNLRNIDSLSDISPSDYDVFIVGSDQIWRAPYFRGMWHAPMKDAFLDFTREWDVKRIAYAASFGIDNISEYTTTDVAECSQAIKRFNAVSVREDSGAGICRQQFGVDAVHVLDPTMLLDKEDYIRLVEQSNVPTSPGDMLCYILDPTDFKNEVVNKVSAEKHLTPFNVIAQTGNYRLPVEQRIQPPVESWLRGFMDAKFVVTDSFHACVFSIIFEKPFLAIGNADRGLSRFTSLLSTFGLQDRLIFPDSQFNENTLRDIVSVDSIYPDLRQESKKFIESSLC